MYSLAESAEEAQKSFKSIAEAIRDMNEHVPDDVTVRTLTRYRNWPRSWLMVMDNFESLGKFKDTSELIPSATNGRILVTSQDPASKQLASNLEDEALRLLPSKAELPTTEKDREYSNQIVKLMGYNPLYIAYIHSYIPLAKVSLEEYLATLEAQKNLYAKENTMKRGRYQK
ncbi:uncharacterized protein PAC_01151 [Phialocephala subalpina]|uniref:NB-ARC domain-containing protein n=1 Tax=Phialocephala subalpina TaxID=576137 RepID=A0A1L7WET7_9HELO|nr:uncharacterized protein PAC_01151 [Phialocephala subalpina]